MLFFISLFIHYYLLFKGKGVVTTNVAASQLEDLHKELEEYRELANNRLQELDKLHQQHRDSLKEVEKLKMDVCPYFCLIESDIFFRIDLKPEFFR